jgi:hypothetical protein
MSSPTYLHVETSALAEALELEGNRCVGVRYSVGNDKSKARASREVVVSGGSINSPQLLELSGIGQPERLCDLGIEVRHALPGVGENLRDHYAPRMRWSHWREGHHFQRQGSRSWPRGTGATLCVLPGRHVGERGGTFDRAHDHSIIDRAIAPNVTVHIPAAATPLVGWLSFQTSEGGTSAPRSGAKNLEKVMRATQSVAGLTMVFALALSIHASPAAGQTLNNGAASDQTVASPSSQPQPQPGSMPTSATSGTKQHVGDSGGDGGDALRRFSEHQRVDGQGGDGGDALGKFSKQQVGGEDGSAALDRFTHTGKASE